MDRRHIWKHLPKDHIEVKITEGEKIVLKCIQYHRNLKKLTFDTIEDSKYPTGMSQNGLAIHLTNLIARGLIRSNDGSRLILTNAGLKHAKRLIGDPSSRFGVENRDPVKPKSTPKKISGKKVKKKR